MEALKKTSKLGSDDIQTLNFKPSDKWDIRLTFDQNKKIMSIKCHCGTEYKVTYKNIKICMVA